VASDFEQVRLYVDMAAQYGQISVAAWTAQLSVVVASVGYAMNSRSRRESGLSLWVCGLIGLLLAAFYAINLTSLFALNADIDLTTKMVGDVWRGAPGLLRPDMRELIQPVEKYVVFGMRAPREIVHAAVLDAVSTVLTVFLLSRIGRRSARAGESSR